MTDETAVRAAVREDVPALMRILRTIELFPAEMLPDMIAPALDDPDCPHLRRLAEREGVVIGFAYCEPERMTEGTWNLLAIGVDAAHQGQGAARALMRELERELAGSGRRLLLVETFGLPEFEAVRGFYTRGGYEREARVRDFYAAGDDKIVFAKRLDAVK